MAWFPKNLTVGFDEYRSPDHGCTTRLAVIRENDPPISYEIKQTIQNLFFVQNWTMAYISYYLNVSLRNVYFATHCADEDEEEEEKDTKSYKVIMNVNELRSGAVSVQFRRRVHDVYTLSLCVRFKDKAQVMNVREELEIWQNNNDSEVFQNFLLQKKAENGMVHDYDIADFLNVKIERYEPPLLGDQYGRGYRVEICKLRRYKKRFVIRIRLYGTMGKKDRVVSFCFMEEKERDMFFQKLEQKLKKISMNKFLDDVQMFKINKQFNMEKVWEYLENE